MGARELAELVQEVRAKQNTYFESRTQMNLGAAKASERMLDKILVQILAEPTQVES